VEAGGDEPLGLGAAPISDGDCGRILTVHRLHAQLGMDFRVTLLHELRGYRSYRVLGEVMRVFAACSIHSAGPMPTQKQGSHIQFKDARGLHSAEDA
jgi:hypothetical protein